MRKKLGAVICVLLIGCGIDNEMGIDDPGEGKAEFPAEYEYFELTFSAFDGFAGCNDELKKRAETFVLAQCLIQSSGDQKCVVGYKPTSEPKRVKDTQCLINVYASTEKLASPHKTFVHKYSDSRAWGSHCKGKETTRNDAEAECVKNCDSSCEEIQTVTVKDLDANDDSYADASWLFSDGENRSDHTCHYVSKFKCGDLVSAD